jgi:NAD+ synthase
MNIDTPTIADSLRQDVEREGERITAWIRQSARRLKRRGAVVGLSGGIDSSVCAALCARALGPARVVGLMMPETDSADETLDLGRLVGTHLGIRTMVENITPMLEAAGCYRRRDEAIRSVVPEYGAGWRSKIVLSTGAGYSVFFVVVESPAGVQTRARLSADAYLAIVAATNFKQRVRKMLEYHYADRFQSAVVGTPNRLEYDQGFFVKNGDGAADIKPIAHLYKTQVYQLAEWLGIPEEIRRRPPTTDTYSLAQSQEEFYFTLPYGQLDVCLFGLNSGLPPEVVAPQVDLTVAQVHRVYADIESKRIATRYLHEPAALVESVLAPARAGGVGW